MSDQPIVYQPSNPSPNADPIQPFPQVVSVRGPIRVYDQAPEELKTLAAAHNAEIAATARRFSDLCGEVFHRFALSAEISPDDPATADMFEASVRAVLRVDRQTCADALIQMAGTYAASGDTGTANGLLLAAQHLAPRTGPGQPLAP